MSLIRGIGLCCCEPFDFFVILVLGTSTRARKVKTFFQSYQQVVVELHDVLPAEVEDEHHVEVDEVGAERQTTQRRQERPGQDPVDDTFN